jgi:hypothetical protein
MKLAAHHNILMVDGLTYLSRVDRHHIVAAATSTRGCAEFRWKPRGNSPSNSRPAGRSTVAMGHSYRFMAPVHDRLDPSVAALIKKLADELAPSGAHRRGVIIGNSDASSGSPLAAGLR